VASRGASASSAGGVTRSDVLVSGTSRFRAGLENQVRRPRRPSEPTEACLLEHGLQPRLSGLRSEPEPDLLRERVRGAHRGRGRVQERRHRVALKVRDTCVEREGLDQQHRAARLEVLAGISGDPDAAGRSSASPRPCTSTRAHSSHAPRTPEMSRPPAPSPHSRTPISLGVIRVAIPSSGCGAPSLGPAGRYGNYQTQLTIRKNTTQPLESMSASASALASYANICSCASTATR
jgi:hypothetical protein